MPDPSPADASLADLEGPWAPGRTWSVLMLMLSLASGGGGGGGGVLEGAGSPSDLSPDVEALLHQVHALARLTTTLIYCPLESWAWPMASRAWKELGAAGQDWVPGSFLLPHLAGELVKWERWHPLK